MPIYSASVTLDVIGLPEPEEGVGYVVSSIVAKSVPDRMDVLSPGTSPADRPIRDSSGAIRAVTRLILAG